MTIFLVNKFGPVCRDDKQGLFLSHLKLTLFLILLITKENRFSGLKISHSINYPPDNIKAPRSQINRILVEGTQSGTESIESIETNPNIDRVIFGPLRKKHYLCYRNRGVKDMTKKDLIEYARRMLLTKHSFIEVLTLYRIYQEKTKDSPESIGIEDISASTASKDSQRISLTISE